MADDNVGKELDKNNPDAEHTKVTIYTDKLCDESCACSKDKTSTVNLPEVGIKKPKTKKERNRKIILAAVFVVLNAIAIGAVLLMELKNENESFAGASALADVLGNNLIFLVFGFVAYLVHLMCDAAAYFAMIKECGYGNRVGLAIRVSILGKYYDNVTPFNTGGQPFQMAYMVRSNIDTPTACSLPIVKFAIRVFFINALAIVMFIFVKTEMSALVIVLACVGIFGSIILPLLLVLFSRNVPFLLRLTKGAVGLLHRMKLVKNYDKLVVKAQDTVDSFLAAFKYLGKHKRMIIIIGLVSLVDFVAINSLPFFAINALGGRVNFIKTLTETFYVSLSSGLMPTPGSSGAAEGAFYSVFANAVPAGYLFWAVLFWRIMVFYFPLAMGVGLLILEWIKGKSKVILVTKEVKWLSKKTINKKPTDAGVAEGEPAAQNSIER